MPDALQTFPMEMGFALFEYSGDGKFLPIAELPEWISEIWAEAGNGSGPISFSAQSPFLENFLFEAEEFWNSPGSAACQSEPWIEKSISGREMPVQARALFLGGKRILALFSPVSQFREQAKILQTARNAWLDHERLAREIQKKEILLHCIVHLLAFLQVIAGPVESSHKNILDTILLESVANDCTPFVCIWSEIFINLSRGSCIRFEINKERIFKVCDCICFSFCILQETLE